MTEHVHSEASESGTGGFAARALCALVGFGAVIGQIVLMRELMAVLNGNELCIGILLAVWLFWTATGSALLRRAFNERASLRIVTAIALSLWGVSLPVTIGMVRGSHAWFTSVPAELLGPVPMLVIAASCMSGFCLLSGGMFALSSRLLARACSSDVSVAPAKAYLLETSGAALGGLLTSFVLLPLFSSFQIAMFLLIVDLGMAAAVFLRTRMFWKLAIAPIGFLLLIPLLYRTAPWVEEFTIQQQWVGFRVLASQDSIYGRIVVTEAGGMRSIYVNGANLANFPDKPAAEEAVHVALLEHPAPKKVLLIGGGMNGSIAEALHHGPMERVDYVELDPALPIVYSHLFPAESQLSFADPRVHAWSGDGRALLASTGEIYDAILVNVPDPDTAQWNRFYTLEFFRLAREHLAGDGILALQLHASGEVISPHTAELLRCVHGTVRQVFPYAVLLPGDPLHLIAARQNLLTEDPRILVERLRNRNLHTMYVREYFLPFRITPDRMAQLHDAVQSQTDPVLNRDFHPRAYYFGIVVWGAQFRAAYASWLETMARVPFLMVGLAISLLLAILVIGFSRGTPSSRRSRIAGRWSLLATGYSLMTLQILVLLAFQSLCGYLFYELALLIGMFMAGMSLGTWLGIRRIRSGTERHLARVSCFNQMGLAVAPALFLLIVSVLAHGATASEHPWLLELTFAVLALLCGIPGGIQFPLAAEICRTDAASQASSAGTFYALDLLGGCAGALLLSGVLIPLYGFWNTAWLALAMSLAPAILAAVAGGFRGTTAQHAPRPLQTLRQ